VAANRRAARLAAERALARIVLPPGAIPVATDPSVSSLLAQDGAAAQPGTPEIVSAHRFWRLAGDPANAVAWLLAHPPGGSKLLVTGTGAKRGVTITWGVSFTFGPIPGVLGQRSLDLSLSAARGAGTALRADGWAQWLIPRPASERVPAGVRSVAVGITTVAGSPFHPRQVSTITDPATVNRIVALIDRLPLAQPGVRLCPAILVGSPLVDLAFLSAGRNTLARAVEDGCGEVRLWIDGRAEPALGESTDLPGALRKLGPWWR
jgi:hypothetical protein